MTPIRIFVSSVQREFADERVALRDYVRGPPLWRFFDMFVFEHVPATNRRPDQLYLSEVERCDLDAGHFGNGYGFEDDHGLSLTEREFDRATEAVAHRLILVRGARKNPATPVHLQRGRQPSGVPNRRIRSWRGPEPQPRQRHGAERPHHPDPGRLRAGGVSRATPT